MKVDLKWLAQGFPHLQELQFLASGGQKAVLSAEHPTAGAVVLKLLHPTTDPESVRRELAAVDGIQSVRVPRILESGEIESNVGELTWFMEDRISGHSLEEVLAARSLSGNEALTLAGQVLGALTLAERVRIVHRDVKPANLIRDDEGQYWLLDFGIARHLELPALTRQSAQFGKFTPGYAPPEQFRNLQAEIDARSDLFALGVTLYESTEGENPYTVDARDSLEVLRRVDTMPLPPLREGLNLESGFRDLVSAMTQRRRDHRPPSAAYALSWLAEICERSGVAAIVEGQ